jgi:hypothetical protein
MWKAVSISVFCLTFFSGILTDAFACAPRAFTEAVVQEIDYQSDIDRLIALRSHPLDELLALANHLEIKWRHINWDHYAQVMIYVCSEIANRGLNDVRVRQQTEHFALSALSHSQMFLWEHQSSLVGWFGHERWSSTDSGWLRERREKTELWLQAWRRLEKQTDPGFDLNDRKNLPAMIVYPPFETGLPAGTPPSAIKNAKLRAQYEAAIAENKRKSQKVDQQLPLLLHGPPFKARAEHWLIGAYSQPPFRNAELKRYLEIYMQDQKTRQRILNEVTKAAK